MEMMVFRCHRIFVAILNGCVLCIVCATFAIHGSIRSFVVVVVVVSSFFESQRCSNSE